MTMPLKDQVAALLSARRQELALTHREVGARAGVSHVTALKAANGTGNTRVDVLDGLLAGLGLEPKVLGPLPPKHQQVLDLLDRVPEATVDVVLTVLTSHAAPAELLQDDAQQA